LKPAPETAAGSFFSPIGRRPAGQDASPSHTRRSKARRRSVLHPRIASQMRGVFAGPRERAGARRGEARHRRCGPLAFEG